MTAAKPKRGRPSKYRPEHIEQARKLALLGMTNDQMAQFFEVGTTTFDRWLRDHADFRCAIKEGRDVADAEVAVSLYKRACGYSHPDVHVSNYQGEITVTPLVKHYPPDTAAAIIWLKNRQPEKWRDRPEPSGENDTPASHRFVFEVVDARKQKPQDGEA